MLINHKKPSLNQGISRPFPSLSHTHSYRVHHLPRIPRVDTIRIAYISSYKIEHPKSHPRYNFQLKYTIYPFSDSPSNFAPTSTSDNIEKYYLFYYSTPTHRFQPSLPSYGLTLIQSLPLFLNLDAIQAARLQFFRNPWHLS